MKKKQLQFIGLLIFNLLIHSHVFCQYQKEGLVSLTNSSFIDFSSKILDTKDSMIKDETKMWFKDSCVIYELRIHLESSTSINEGTLVKKSYPVWKYIYLDLRTMICQDYLNLQDTALPFCNYSLKPDDASGIWAFFAPKKESDTLHGLFPLNDTIISNTTFKRIKILYKYYEYEKSYSVYYFDCAAKQNMFYFNRTLGEMYPNCKPRKLDFFDSTNKLIIKGEINVVRDKLNLKEDCIFKQWNKNAKNTKLPMLTVSESEKIHISEPEHENPTITILPREKK